MKKTVLASAILIGLSYQSTAFADTHQRRIVELENQLLALKQEYEFEGNNPQSDTFFDTRRETPNIEVFSEQTPSDAERIAMLEQEINALREAYIEGAPQRIRRIAGAVEEKQEAEKKERAEWYKQIELGAQIELEAGYVSPYEGESESDITVATFSPYITSRVNDWISVQGALLYEEDATDLEVDIATVSITNPDRSPLYSIIGQTYLPFGNYSTEMVSDPLSLEIGETRETAIQLGATANGFNANVYAFNGDIDKPNKDQVNSFGATLSYGTQINTINIGLGVAYTNNMGDSDGLQEGITISDRVPGLATHVSIESRNFGLLGDYVTATDRFDPTDYAFRGEGAQPAAWNVEGIYKFPSFQKESLVAVGYQGSKESIDLALPEQRLIAVYRMFFMRNTSLAVEYAYDKDYSIVEGGSGKSSTSLTGQLAVVF